MRVGCEGAGIRVVCKGKYFRVGYGGVCESGEKVPASVWAVSESGVKESVSESGVTALMPPKGSLWLRGDKRLRD